MKYKRSILILGGTGAMGTYLCKSLDDGYNSITVTSRKEHVSDSPNLKYIRGNAKEISFITELLASEKYDVIIDFMNYNTYEFKERYKIFLKQTSQYIFISSARVYAESDFPLTEDSPRLLDICQDQEYLSTDEYALSKARQENMLINSLSKNYTIVRPSLTYSSERLQFAISEKEEWLYRALHDRSVVFPKDMVNIKTTMAWGGDVAGAISKLVGNEKAFGEIVHIAGRTSNTWDEIFDIYQNVFKDKTGKEIKVFMPEDSLEVGQTLGRFYQIKYARRINRSFNNKKLDDIIGPFQFLSPEEGLKKCLADFLDKINRFNPIEARPHAYFDRLTGEHTSLKEFYGDKRKLKYIILRYSPFF